MNSPIDERHEREAGEDQPRTRDRRALSHLAGRGAQPNAAPFTSADGSGPPGSPGRSPVGSRVLRRQGATHTAPDGWLETRGFPDGPSDRCGGTAADEGRLRGAMSGAPPRAEDQWREALAVELLDQAPVDDSAGRSRSTSARMWLDMKTVDLPPATSSRTLGPRTPAGSRPLAVCRARAAPGHGAPPEAPAAGCRARPSGRMRSGMPQPERSIARRRGRVADAAARRATSRFSITVSSGYAWLTRRVPDVAQRSGVFCRPSVRAPSPTPMRAGSSRAASDRGGLARAIQAEA
jgi:hypothetical protein